MSLEKYKLSSLLDKQNAKGSAEPKSVKVEKKKSKTKIIKPKKKKK